MSERSYLPDPQTPADATLSRRLARNCVRIAVLLLLAYALACGLGYWQQRKLLYFPEGTRVAAADTDFSLRNGGVLLRGWVVNPGQSRALLYFGGNGEPLGLEIGQIGALFPHRTVYLLAYRGYGASEGEPTEQGLFADAVALFDRVRRQHVSIAVVGRSLGSGVASYLASQRPVERLALVTPFDSILNVARAHYPWLPVGWILKDRYESTRYIPSYDGPILVLRAGRDEVIPSIDTDRLITAMRNLPSIAAFPLAGHNSISDDPGYASAISDFMK